MRIYGFIAVSLLLILTNNIEADETYEAILDGALVWVSEPYVTIDGDLSDWVYAPRMTFSGEAWQPNGGTWLDEADLTMTFMMKWGDESDYWGYAGSFENLYIAAIVKDEAHINTFNDQNIWAGDGIQIMIDPTGERAKIDGVVYEFGYALAGPNSDQPMSWRWLKNDSGPEIFESEFVILRNDAAGTTVYEIRLPREQVVSAELDWWWDHLGFAIIANDGDPGAEKQGGWVGWGAEAIIDEKEADELQIVYLVPPMTPVQPDGKLPSAWGALKSKSHR